MDAQRHITHFTQTPARDGANAVGTLFESIYTDLQHVASGLMRHERTGHTLGTSGVLHEAYQRLIRTYADSSSSKEMSQDELRAITAKIMRRVLVDHARTRNARQRADDTRQDLVSKSVEDLSPLVVDLIVLDEALDELTLIDARKASIVELRFFGAMPMSRVAEMIGQPLRSVERDWALARAWLGMKVRGGGSSGD